MGRCRLAAIGVICLIFVVLASGCSPAIVRVPNDFALTERPTMPSTIPLRVGLYLSPAFLNYKLPGYSGKMAVIVELGEAMGSGAERSLKQIFRDVVTLREDTADATVKGVDFIVTPEIVKGDLTGIGSYWCRISCKWTVVDPVGKVIYVTTIAGDKELKRFTTTFGAKKAVEDCVVLAVQDHYEKFLQQFPAARWWESSR
jgi:hypothetical protein